MFKEFLTFGDQLIEQTRELVLSLWHKNVFHSELKADQTPVSEVDLKCEELARAAIRKRFPDHGIIGEEFGAERSDAEFVWTIDPIDGTQNLVNRIPTFGTILALVHKGQPVLGWIDHPALGDSLRGGSGVGVFRNGKQVHTGDLAADELTANDVIATNCPATFGRGGHLDIFDKVISFHPHSRIYYDVFSHTLAITGSLAFMVEYNLKIWDLAATQALITEAGGVYRQIGVELVPGKPLLYHAVFGKKRAVELILPTICLP